MNKISLLWLLVFPFVSVFSQTDMGTIEITGKQSATFKFSSAIQSVIFANNPQIGEANGIPQFKYFDSYSEGKALVIRLNEGTNSSVESSFTVLLDQNDEVFFGIVKIGTNGKLFYNFSNISSQKSKIEVKQLQDSMNIKVSETRLAERLKFVMAEKIQYNTIGKKENELGIQVATIMNDDKYTYIKIIIQNTSGSDYVIDNIKFKYVEGKHKGLKKKENKIEERIYDVYKTSNTIVKAYSLEEIGYIIPLFTTGNKGNLIIELNDKNGTRFPEITIPGSVMLKVKKLNI